MALSTGIQWLIGGAVAAAVVGLVAAASSKPAAPASPATPGAAPASSTLKAGERYLVTQTAAIATPITAAQAQALFDAIAPGAVRVVSINQISPSIVTMTIDALQNLPIVLPPLMTMQDLGPSPSP